MSEVYKLFKINAVMETGNDKDPIVFTFDLPGTDENAVGLVLSEMKSVKRIISIEKTTSRMDRTYSNPSLYENKIKKEDERE